MGVKFYVAAKIIERENPCVRAQKILACCYEKSEFDPSRVWVRVNINDVVVFVPKVG